MTIKTLLAASKKYLLDHPGYTDCSIGLNIFSSGAAWMQGHLLQMDGKPAHPLRDANMFTKYGVLKYGISLSAFIIAMLLLVKYCILLLPLSIVTFYLIEVQFLFLFPLLIDGVQSPILQSLQATNKVGMFRALIITMALGIFMVMGLLRLKDPLHNWHVGCLAVLIWYRDEVRDRL